MKRLILMAIGVMTLAVGAPAAPGEALIPWPAHVEWREGALVIDAGFRVRIAGHDDARLRAGLGRALDRLEKRVGLDFGPRYVISGGTLVVSCVGAGSVLPQLGDDESYTLEVRTSGAALQAANVVGVLRGLETFLQLVEKQKEGGLAAAGVKIQDAPRFPWRGLMIDVARHFQPLPVIYRNLDAMAAVKMNVLHLHLTDDQGFRIESKRHPELHAVSQESGVFTQEQIKAIIAAAAERGIRVVPEFDVPGHATAWLASHPEIASVPRAYAVARNWGVLNPVMDPTRPETLVLLESFFGEMAALFPDKFFHIGGDENNGKDWNASERIAAFKHEHGLATNEALHAWFNQQLAAMMTRHGKRLVGWDEVLHPDFPRSAVVHSWRGADSLAQAAQQGFAGILSAGYYLDLHYSAAEHYAADPLPADSTLTPEQAARVLGGEAPMWSEWADARIYDFRVWPRAAAVAERLWSPREVRDVSDMYRRLARVDQWLVETGLQHHAWPRFDGYSPEQAAVLRVLATAVEPVKRYERGRIQTGSLDYALNDLADWAQSESRPAREFADKLEAWLALTAEQRVPGAEDLFEQLALWREAARIAAAMPANDDIAQGRVETARLLVELTDTARLAIVATVHEQRLAPEQAAQAKELLARAAKPTKAAVEFPFLPAIRRLIAAVSP